MGSNIELLANKVVS